jgi:hypothetical protein
VQIILTDWPKPKSIEANYRGVETEKLLSLRLSMFHTMMSTTSEVTCGYVIYFRDDKVEEELKFRKVPLQEL